MSACRLGHDGSVVYAVEEPGGRTLFAMPWNQALEFARQITVQARLAETECKADRLVFDQAVVLRAGLPFGVSDDPRINEAARSEAAWNSKLRRWFKLPEIRRRGVGTPKLIEKP